MINNSKLRRIVYSRKSTSFVSYIRSSTLVQHSSLFHGWLGDDIKSRVSGGEGGWTTVIILIDLRPLFINQRSVKIPVSFISLLINDNLKKSSFMLHRLEEMMFSHSIKNRSRIESSLYKIE